MGMLEPSPRGVRDEAGLVDNRWEPSKEPQRSWRAKRNQTPSCPITQPAEGTYSVVTTTEFDSATDLGRSSILATGPQRLHAGGKIAAIWRFNFPASAMNE
ncbi:MAG TPA: hypothetical protein VED84_00460 [Acidimicrobiales bacterium]|nr:hypothetical protein [Acidimicrobiales bacterium]